VYTVSVRPLGWSVSKGGLRRGECVDLASLREVGTASAKKVSERLARQNFTGVAGHRPVSIQTFPRAGRLHVTVFKLVLLFAEPRATWSELNELLLGSLKQQKLRTSHQLKLPSLLLSFRSGPQFFRTSRSSGHRGKFQNTV